MSHTRESTPLRYRLCRPAWPEMAVTALFLVLMGPILFRLPERSGKLGIVLWCISCLPLVPLCSIKAFRSWRWGQAWECRIEADVLSFRTPAEPQMTSVRISDIEQIVGVRGKKQAWFEIAMRGWTPVRVVDAEVLEDGLWRTLNGAVRIRPKLRAALLAVNPAIHFSRRRE